MKTSLLLICLLLFFSAACKKDKDPEPPATGDFRVQYIGTYTTSGIFGHYDSPPFNDSNYQYQKDTTMDLIIQLSEQDSMLVVLARPVKIGADKHLYTVEGSFRTLTGNFVNDSIYFHATIGARGEGDWYELRGRKK